MGAAIVLRSGDRFWTDRPVAFFSDWDSFSDDHFEVVDESRSLFRSIQTGQLVSFDPDEPVSDQAYGLEPAYAGGIVSDLPIEERRIDASLVMRVGYLTVPRPKSKPATSARQPAVRTGPKRTKPKPAPVGGRREVWLRLC